MRQSLDVDLAGLRLRSPIVAASGCFGLGRESAGLVEPQRLGAIVTRSITLRPEKGSPPPRLAETASGVLSSVGLQNPGIDAFIADELPRLARTGVPLIVSIAGTRVDECLQIASLLQNAPGLVALELYLGSPDEEHDGEPFHSRPDRAGEIVGAVARLSRLPVFAKLPALVPDLVETARWCVRAGAHGLTLIDAIPAMSVDVARLLPKLASVVGGLSGPAIHPIAVASVFRVSQAMPDVPIFGVGGVADADAAVQLLLAGAWAIQVGTAMLIDPSVPARITQGILAYLKTKGLAAPADIQGRVRVPRPAPNSQEVLRSL